ADFTATREKPKQLILAGKLNHIDEGVLCVFRDVTDERTKEQMKRTFLSLISHKLKTPLTAVIGFGEILAEEVKDDPRKAKAADSILTQGRKLQDLVDKLLRYTRIEDPNSTVALQPVAVDALVAESLEAMKTWLDAHKAAVDYQGAAGAVVVGDKERL